MKKSLSVPAILGSIAIVLVVVIVLFFMSGGSSAPPSTATDERILEALEKSEGDISKLDPELRKLYDEGVKSGRYKTGGGSTVKPSSGMQ